MNQKSIKKIWFIFLSFSALYFLFSCSLNYAKTTDASASIPEFIFSDINMVRSESDTITVSLKANILEQYKNGNLTYAKDVTFTTFDKKGNIDTLGECAMIVADSDNEDYTLYDNVKLSNKEHNLQLQAKNIHWNGKSQQITSGIADKVSITTGIFSDAKNSDIKSTIEGTGFNASALSLNYSFQQNIIGYIDIEEEDE